MNGTCKPKYTGATPGADANDYVLFSTTVAFPSQASACVMMGLERLFLSLRNDQAGTIKLQVSEDRGTNWATISTQAVAAIAANTDNEFDYASMPAHGDVRIVWTNGGSAQTTWAVRMYLTTGRSPLA